MLEATSFIEEMRLDHKGMANRPEPTSYFITLWEISELESQIEYKKTFRVRGKLEIFRDKNSSSGKPIKQKYIYAGRDGEAFWFTTSKQKVKEDKKDGKKSKEEKQAKKEEKKGEKKTKEKEWVEVLEINILQPGSTEVEKHEIPADSPLHHFVTKGTDHNTNNIQGGQSGPNIIPTIIKDDKGNQLVVFTHFQFKANGSVVKFYDIKIKRVIARAKGPQTLLMHFNIEDDEQTLLVYLRDPITERLPYDSLEALVKSKQLTQLNKRHSRASKHIQG